MTTLLYFVLVLGVLIFVHELGHFITAKLAGIAVPRFSIGLGPKIGGFKFGETEYVISALPLGGYVKMAGMGEDEGMEALEGGKSELAVPPERRFDSKSLGTRAIVISAGVIMNFAFGIIAFAGIDYYQSWEPLIGEVAEGEPAAEAGMLAGDLIVALDEQEIERWTQLQSYVGRRPGQEILVKVRRDGRELELPTRVRTDTAVIEPADTLIFGMIGIVRDTISASRTVGVAGSLVAGTRTSFEITGLILDYIGKLLTGKASPRELGGPIMIGQLSGQAGRAGPIILLRFMAILSVNLAILNLLPIPILDGGHLVFLGIEAVRGQALSQQARVRLSQVGLILLLAIMVWAITSDLLRVTGN